MGLELWTLIPAIAVSTFLMYILGTMMNYSAPLSFTGFIQFNILFTIIIGLIYGTKNIMEKLK